MVFFQHVEFIDNQELRDFGIRQLHFENFSQGHINEPIVAAVNKGPPQPNLYFFLKTQHATKMYHTKDCHTDFRAISPYFDVGFEFLKSQHATKM